jgi:hypothetical protein
LETIEFPLELPDEVLSLASPTQKGPRWWFPGYSLDKVATLLRSCTASESEVDQFLEGAEWEAVAAYPPGLFRGGVPLAALASNGVWVSPPPPLVLNLSAAARRRIHGVLATSELNPDQRYPSRFLPDVFRSQLARAGLPREKAAVVRQLAYKADDVLCLADWSVLHQLLAADEFARVLKSFSQTPTFVLRVRVPAEDEVDELADYWGGGGRLHAVKPLLEGLAKVPDIRSVRVSFFMPAFARTRLYTYPDPESGPAEPREDCLWTALNFFNDQPDNRYLDRDFAERALNAQFERCQSDPRLGDLVVLPAPTGGWVHMGVYIADGVVFTKGGVGRVQPWVLMKIPDMVMRFRSLSSAEPVIYARKQV